MTRYRCAHEARSRDEPLYGTASHVRRWVLLEQPGPWGRDAVVESRLPAAVATELEARAAELNARLILLRRPGGRQTQRRRFFVARSDLAVVEEFAFDHVADVLDLDLSPLAAGQPVGGEPVTAPLYLVCTNGRHDACCAEYGRPLAQALEDATGERAWECSHIGGDRFAGNLVCFPHGLYFGHVGADEGSRVADLYDRGLIDLDRYRGRSCHPFVVQAAEYFLRAQRDLSHVDDVSYVRRRPLDDDAFRVVFAGRAQEMFSVDLRVSRAPEGRRLTCQALLATRPPRYELLAVMTGADSSSLSSSPPSRSGPSSSSSSPSRPRR
ncbi:MAG TPA: sucrase ferredoxin [Egibacteraceae bacterium]|nr:sucrase ferredoxin [Egibacteraceae bacterium]